MRMTDWQWVLSGMMVLNIMVLYVLELLRCFAVVCVSKVRLWTTNMHRPWTLIIKDSNMMHCNCESCETCESFWLCGIVWEAWVWTLLKTMTICDLFTRWECRKLCSLFLMSSNVGALKVWCRMMLLSFWMVSRKRTGVLTRRAGDDVFKRTVLGMCGCEGLRLWRLLNYGVTVSGVRGNVEEEFHLMKFSCSGGNVMFLWASCHV